MKLKGIHRVQSRLASGALATYWYAWRGGPRLSGQPGSHEFLKDYAAAIAKKPAGRHEGTIIAILNKYQASSDWLKLADRTRSDYVKMIGKIEGMFGDFPLGGLSDRRARAEFLEWRDAEALKSKRQSDYLFSVFARALSWAKGRGLIDDNPLEKIGRTYQADRTEKVWTLEDEEAFLKKAPPHMHLAFMLAIWTGQRQGDLLKLTWTAFDGSTIKLRQGKTGARVTIPVGAPLKAALASAKRSGVLILTTKAGASWTADGFRVSWRKACQKAGVENLTFHDIRGTTVTRLALSGATTMEIATITGHSIKDVEGILDAHYLYRDPALARSAMAKLERTFGERGL